jgi:hypothetical protein
MSGLPSDVLVSWSAASPYDSLRSALLTLGTVRFIKPIGISFIEINIKHTYTTLKIYYLSVYFV